MPAPHDSMQGFQRHLRRALLRAALASTRALQVWWWFPQDSVQGFKAAAEVMTEGGRGELYTKSISPFLSDREYGMPEHIMPLEVSPKALTLRSATRARTQLSASLRGGVGHRAAWGACAETC